MLNFYRKFIKNAALILAPLTNALKGPGKLLDWTPPLDTAFCHARDILSTVPILVHPIPGAPISLAVDASDTHVGGVLQQHVQQSWSPLGFSPGSCQTPRLATPLSTVSSWLPSLPSAISVFYPKVEISSYSLIINL